MQLTQFLSLEDTMDVAGGTCKPPYRCRQCANRRQDKVPDPEHVGEAYRTNACDRPNRTLPQSVREWLRAEAERINRVAGRVAEIRREVLEDGTRTERAALFVIGR